MLQYIITLHVRCLIGGQIADALISTITSTYMVIFVHSSVKFPYVVYHSYCAAWSIDILDFYLQFVVNILSKNRTSIFPRLFFLSYLCF
jgi:hypothetical protein